MNVSTGQLERELAVHSGPVLGLEWSSSNPAAGLLSWAHCPLTGCGPGFGRNELIHTNILTGTQQALRPEQGKEVGEHRIIAVKVSQQKKYFVVAFASGPFELWDLERLQLLRTMPRKFPTITSVEWGGGPGGRSNRRAGGDEEAGQQARRELIVLTDTHGQLYHFTVEGRGIRDGTKIPAETGLGTVHCIAWKADLIVRGDSEGNVNVWNMKTRQSKNIHTGRGAVKRLAFSPGIFHYTQDVSLNPVFPPTNRQNKFGITGCPERKGGVRPVQSQIKFRFNFAIFSLGKGGFPLSYIPNSVWKVVISKDQSLICLFPTGKNNLKLLVLLETAVQIWEAREAELMTEVRVV